MKQPKPESQTASSPESKPSTVAQPVKAPPLGFLRLPQVLALIPVCKATWWAGIQTGRFPRGIKLSMRTTGWRRADIEKLLEELGSEKAAE